MLPLVDFKCTEDDDIILNDDIQEGEVSESIINVTERRLVARYDDYLYDPIAAGLERFLFQNKTFITQENIKTAITNSLLSDLLFHPNDYTIEITETNNRIVNIIIVFKEYLGIDRLFRIVVDISNQRIYKG